MILPVAATITWARTREEADLLYNSLHGLARHLPLVIADGGSHEHFLDQIRTLSNATVVTPKAKGASRLLSQVKAAVAGARALNPGYVLYTEPDKGWFFEQRLGDFLAQAKNHTEAGVIVAARDASSFSTFPSGQRLTESLMNRLCAETFGQAGDFTYGPLLIRSDLLPGLQRIDGDIGWGWRFFLMALSWRMRLPLPLWTAALPCPPEQRAEDDARSRIYRMEQLAQNVKGLALGMKTPRE